MTSINNQVELDGVSRQGLLDLIGVAPATLSRWLAVLHQRLKNCPQWHYRPGHGGYNGETLKAILIYSQLVRDYGKRYADSHIVKELEKHGYQFDQNHQNQHHHQRDKTGGNGAGNDYYADLFSR